MDGTRTFQIHPLRRSGQIGLVTADRIAIEPRTIDTVAIYFSRLGAPMYTHEKVTLSIVAESIARASGWRFAGVYDPAGRSGGGVFFVPDDRSCSTRRKISEFVLRISSTARSCHILSSRRKPSRMGLSARMRRDRAAGHRHSQTACGMRSCRVTRYLALTTQGWQRCGCCR